MSLKHRIHMNKNIFFLFYRRKKTYLSHNKIVKRTFLHILSTKSALGGGIDVIRIYTFLGMKDKFSVSNFHSKETFMLKRKEMQLPKEARRLITFITAVCVLFLSRRYLIELFTPTTIFHLFRIFERDSIV